MNPIQMSLREMVRRRWGLLLPLAIVVCVVSITVVVWTLRDATTQRVRRITAQMGNNLLFVPRDASVDGYFAAVGVQAEMAEEKMEYLADHCPVTRQHATHYVAKFQQRVKVNNAEVILTGFHVLHGEHVPGVMKRRRSFLDDKLDAGFVILGSEAGRLTGLKTGDTARIEDREFKVKYVLPEFGILDDSRVWARLKEVQGIYNKKGVVHGVDALGCLCSGPYFEQIRIEVAKQVPDLRMVHAQVIADVREKSRVAVEGVGAIVLAIVTILGAAAILTAAAAEVRERRGEIGVLLAMGAGGGRILLLFLPKILLVGVLGGSLGWALGSVLAAWIAPALAGLGPDVPVLVVVDLLPWSAALGLVFSLVASSLAVWRAARLDPVEALREL
jgi:putative ABC transport system permease protein